MPRFSRTGQRGGLKARLMIAAVLVIFSLISFYSSGSVNPVTGEHQRVGLSTDQEIAMGLQAAPEMAQQHGGLSPDPAARANVDAVGRRLLKALNEQLRAEGMQNPYQFEFHLLRDPETVNAFALPGGQVFITAALYTRLETEGQLAGVLGHEIGHVLSRHGAQRLAKQKLTQGLAGAAGVAGGDQNSAQMAMAVGNMINMQYGRNDELESDKWGVILTADAGYDPRAMLGVMRILDEASGDGGPPEMLSTHPKPANRARYVELLLEETFPNGVPDGLEP
jgi:predicted Zn-dependent protease